MKHKIVYFKNHVGSGNKEGLIVDEIEASDHEEAAFLFNKKHFPYFGRLTFSKFKKYSEHQKYWNLTINGSDYGTFTLEHHRQYIKKINLETKRLRVLYTED